MVDPPQDLLESLRDGRCALFVGAGLSQAAGYPNWSDLLRELISKAEELSALPDNRGAELRDHLAQHEYLLVAEELRDQMGEGTFRDELAKVFLFERDITDAHKALYRVGAACIITTNYDKLIENAYAFEYR